MRASHPVARAWAWIAGVPMVLLVRGLFAVARALGPERSSDLGAAVTQTLGRFFKQNRIALKNVRAAFPEKSDEEVRAIVRTAWSNLGRTAAEYPHLGTIFDFDPEDQSRGRIEVSEADIEHFLALRDDGRAGIIFSAHLGNWELPAVCAARFGLETTAIFRPPNDPAAARLVAEIRSGTMGGLAASTGAGAAYAISGVLDRGGHVGQLIDQHFTRGVVVDFMGRPALTNPLLAKLARHYDVPVHGARVIRLQGHRFRLEITPPLDLPRDAEGLIDVPGAVQAMTRVVEGWVREHPEQWLWMHRRWRVPGA
ncbi:lipid A biosynthesis lauroyl acyltransferase [Enterovirga rhinocerotis]|uniref:KDO2-lipid IV(A) lauroyltransferase n=1 Tax=Enterovirga rhinocerotis TaxID=1339210 RepID=A0A4R7C3V3_9HYPH|nr:lipid A biosynthesis lauroyl acyltransferase [Enterovirga rhinocerotis]TDR93078.1 KDO2-lipid IV(A) lauroyltransferase [Enterovirga rhinocerotis]